MDTEAVFRSILCGGVVSLCFGEAVFAAAVKLRVLLRRSLIAYTTGPCMRLQEFRMLLW